MKNILELENSRSSNNNLHNFSENVVETPGLTPVKKQLQVDELVEELRDLKSIISCSEANSVQSQM